jgi:ubiquinone/menaquinone biosynthesis C-methylase UbiE
MTEIQRVDRSREQARVSYDRLSRWYDWFAGDEWKFTLAGLRALEPQKGARVLEIGPGTGHALAWLASTIGPGGCVVGLDLSAGMLKRARRRLTQIAPVQPADLCQGDALHLPFPPSTFDHIFLSFTLELFDTPEIQPFLVECTRVLRPAGSLGVVALSRDHSMAVRLYEWCHAHWPALVDCRPIHARTSLEQAGFGIHSSQRMRMWGLPVEILCAVPARKVTHDSPARA